MVSSEGDMRSQLQPFPRTGVFEHLSVTCNFIHTGKDAPAWILFAPTSPATFSSAWLILMSSLLRSHLPSCVKPILPSVALLRSSSSASVRNLPPPSTSQGASASPTTCISSTLDVGLCHVTPTHLTRHWYDFAFKRPFGQVPLALIYTEWRLAVVNRPLVGTRYDPCKCVLL